MRQTNRSDRLIGIARIDLTRNLNAPFHLRNPGNKSLPALAIRLPEQNLPPRRQVLPPKPFQIFPLLLFVKNIRSEYQIESLIQMICLPIQLSRTYAHRIWKRIQSRE